MRRMKMGFAFLSLSMFAALFTGGCDDLEESVNCNAACEKYASCEDNDYDSAGCFDRCETRSDNDKDFASRVNVCDACLEGKACDEQAGCLEDCPDFF